MSKCTQQLKGKTDAVMELLKQKFAATLSLYATTPMALFELYKIQMALFT